VKPTTLVLALSMLLAAPAARAADTRPMAAIRATTDQILAVLQDPALQADDKRAERRSKIRKLVDARFQWADMAQRCLSIHWRRRSPEERKAFVPVFADLVRGAYMGKIEGYAGEKVKYKNERVKGKYARVGVDVLTTKNTVIPIVYSMKLFGDRWLIYDVAVEGVRLVNNYRTQFRAKLDRMPYQEFFDELEAKVAETQKGE